MAIPPARALDPTVERLNRAGTAAIARGELEQGYALLQQSLQRLPQQPALHLGLSAALMDRGRAAEALEHLNKALRLQPRYPEALYNRANVLSQLGRLEEALVDYNRAIALKPQFPSAYCNRAHTLLRLQRPERALESLETALHQQPSFALAQSLRGTILAQVQRHAEALECFEAALACAPDSAPVLLNRGLALQALRRHDEAVISFERALDCDRSLARAWFSRGISLRESGHPDRAIDSLLRTLELDPQFDCGLGELRSAHAVAADWSDDAALRARLLADVAAGRHATMPFVLLAVTDDPGAQLSSARAHVAAEALANATALAPERPYGHERLRIGYLSGDLREHAVAYLIAGLIERHDRARFEIFAFSLRPAEASSYGTRIGTAVDHFIDLYSSSDRAAAECIRALEIDILIDLSGYTQGCRSTLLARRPAPIQVNYLGYPGTLGAPFIDYIIADEYLIPEAERPHYAEQVLYLPDCFQANDDRRVHPEATARSELGLPEQALVLCCFNNSDKLNPTIFEVWMRLLAARSDAVLWLVSGLPIVEQNLRREAAARGIDPARLHFAARLPYEQHLARLAAADLFLDTLPFNGGTTVSDALWMGVPVLTCSGQAFAARMAGSLLTAMGLPELIARDLGHYEQRALELLEQPQQLAALRGRLREARTSSALFDTARFTRHFEAALIAIQERFERAVPSA